MSSNITSKRPHTRTNRRRSLMVLNQSSSSSSSTRQADVVGPVVVVGSCGSGGGINMKSTTPATGNIRTKSPSTVLLVVILMLLVTMFGMNLYQLTHPLRTATTTTMTTYVATNNNNNNNNNSNEPSLMTTTGNSRSSRSSRSSIRTPLNTDQRRVTASVVTEESFQTNEAHASKHVIAYRQDDHHHHQQQQQQQQSHRYYYQPIPPRLEGIQLNFVKAGDFIYYRDDHHWDSAPIVIESHKLIFFTVAKAGCTVWKQLFRRMMGYHDWKSQRNDPQKKASSLPHNPIHNGLVYLYNYTLEQASMMMTSPDWTRAMMVREPKMRFLSAFLDKAISNHHRHIIDRCCPDQSCIVSATKSLLGFLHLCQRCDDDHWRSQHDRIDHKYWPYIDHVLHVENAAHDAQLLLKQIGAWDEYGKTGWGDDDDDEGNSNTTKQGSHRGGGAIFSSQEIGNAGHHATWSQWQIWKWYTPESEQMVERFYQSDYENPMLNFSLRNNGCLTCMPQQQQQQKP